jgi:hypothetical protein
LTRLRSTVTIVSPAISRRKNEEEAMRIALVVFVVTCVSACGGSSVAPSEVSIGTATNIAGTWNGTIVSSNNATAQVRMVLTQSGSDVSGTWNSTSVSWEGQISGAVSGSSFTGQLKFSGTVTDGTVCTGTANVVGSATASTMAWTSASGVVGGSCTAALPTGLKIDVQRQ